MKEKNASDGRGTVDPRVEGFITRWQGREGGQERANYALFLTELCDLYANFRRDGKAYDQFPDRQSFRVYLEDLRRPEVRDHLVAIWTDPQSLDPAKNSARVTRAIAQRLAAVSKALEEQHHSAEEVAMFIMRCLFTMFADHRRGTRGLDC